MFTLGCYATKKINDRNAAGFDRKTLIHVNTEIKRGTITVGSQSVTTSRLNLN
jgi:hypothetical protein